MDPDEMKKKKQNEEQDAKAVIIISCFPINTMGTILIRINSVSHQTKLCTKPTHCDELSIRLHTVCIRFFGNYGTTSYLNEQKKRWF